MHFVHCNEFTNTALTGKSSSVIIYTLNYELVSKKEENMKRNLSKILILTLILCMVFVFAACDKLPFGQDKGDDSNSDTNGDGSQDTGDTPADSDASKLQLFDENGKAKFQVVFTSKSAQSGAGIASAFVERLKKMGALPENAEAVRDSDVNQVKECEIIIGAEALNRGDDCSISTKYLGEDGQAIKIVGNRVIIASGSPGDLDRRFQNFVRNQLGISTTAKKIDGAISVDRSYTYELLTTYKITSIKVNDKDLRNYKLVLDVSSVNANEDIQNINNFRTNLYEASGYWLEVGEVDKLDTYENAFVIRKVADAGAEGFRAYVEEDGDFIVECAYDNAFNGAFGKFAIDMFTSQQGSLTFNHSFVTNEETQAKETAMLYTKDVSVAYYEDFKAVGDGTTDCFEAIYNTHVYANRGGQKVMSRGGATATYYISPKYFTKSIPVMTDVDLNGCTFLVDDTGDDAYANYGLHLFLFERDNPTITFDDVLLNVEVLDEKGNPTYNKDGTPKMTVDGVIDDERFQGVKLLNVTANDPDNKVYNDFSWLVAEGLISENGNLIRLYNKNHRDFIRHGSNQNSGNVRTDVFVVDKDGKISADTPIAYEFEAITKIEIFGIDDKEITFENGNFINICCRTVAATTYKDPNGKVTKYANDWVGYQRTLGIFRTNVTMRNLTHNMKDEPNVGFVPDAIKSQYDKKNDQHYSNYGSRYESYPYYGFFYIYTTYNFHAYDSQITGHTVYYENKPATASTGGKIPPPVAMGTYDLIVEYSSHVYLENIQQVNSSTPDTGIGDGRYWGVMSSNGARNMFFTNCTINRFDAHRGFWNATLKDVTIGHSFQVVGGGYLIAENVTKVTKSNFMTFRGDYGATFNGDITLKDCTQLGFGTYNTARGQKDTTKGEPVNKCVIFDPGYDIENSGWQEKQATIEEKSAGAYWLWYFGYTCYMPRNITIDNFKFNCKEMSIFDQLPNEIFHKTYIEDDPTFVPTAETVRYPYQITESVTFVNYTDLRNGTFRNDKTAGNNLVMTFFDEDTDIKSIQTKCVVQ